MTTHRPIAAAAMTRPGAVARSALHLRTATRAANALLAVALLAATTRVAAGALPDAAANTPAPPRRAFHYFPTLPRDEHGAAVLPRQLRDDELLSVDVRGGKGGESGARRLDWENQHDKNVITSPRVTLVFAGDRWDPYSRDRGECADSASWEAKALRARLLALLACQIVISPSTNFPRVETLYLHARRLPSRCCAVRAFVDGLGQSDWWKLTTMYNGPSGSVPATITRSGDVWLHDSDITATKVKFGGLKNAALNISGGVPNLVDDLVANGKIVTWTPGVSHNILFLADDRIMTIDHCTVHCGEQRLAQLPTGQPVLVR
jgi:hypothetical protein